jgi:hypothetical protein
MEWLNSEEETKIRFFESVKNDNISEVVKFFRNDRLKVWLLREEDEYTGIIYLI